METERFDYNPPGGHDSADRSPKVRKLLGRQPRGLYIMGYIAIAFCLVALVAVSCLLGWI